MENASSELRQLRTPLQLKVTFILCTYVQLYTVQESHRQHFMGLDVGMEYGWQEGAKDGKKWCRKPKNSMSEELLCDQVFNFAGVGIENIKTARGTKGDGGSATN